MVHAQALHITKKGAAKQRFKTSLQFKLIQQKIARQAPEAHVIQVMDAQMVLNAMQLFHIGRINSGVYPVFILTRKREQGKLHVDAWREVSLVSGYSVQVVEQPGNDDAELLRLFFINLGGYQEGLFDEPHFKVLTVQPNKSKAFAYAKDTPFYHQVHFPGAESHIDDKYRLDVDDLHEIADILPTGQKAEYALRITPAPDNASEDQIHLGYFKLDKLP